MAHVFDGKLFFTRDHKGNFISKDLKLPQPKPAPRPQAKTSSKASASGEHVQLFLLARIAAVVIVWYAVGPLPDGSGAQPFPVRTLLCASPRVRGGRCPVGWAPAVYWAQRPTGEGQRTSAAEAPRDWDGQRS